VAISKPLLGTNSWVFCAMVLVLSWRTVAAIGRWCCGGYRTDEKEKNVRMAL
jgi:hypothetical protein